MKKYTAYSLVEILIAIGMFGLICTSIIFFSVEVFSSTYNFQRKVNADIYREKVFREVSFIKDHSWEKILANTSTSPMYIIQNGDDYEIVEGTFSFGDISYYITIENVKRDSNGEIADSGTIDPHSRKIILHFTWEDKLGRDVEYTTSFFVNDWNTYTWVQTSQEDFNHGSNYQTRVTNNSGGEVTLQQIFYPDWCRPTLAINQYDIPGNATAKTLFSKIGTTYLGTGGNATGSSLTKLNITGVENPTINVEGTFNGYLTNNIFVEGNYAYLATTDNSKEVVIVDISTTPYTEIGYFNTSRTEDANSVYVVGNIGYVAAGRYVFTFDLSSKTGSRTQLGMKQVSLNQNLFQTASVSQIIVRDNYLYASLHNDWYELAIVDVTNPSNMIITSQTSVNNQQTLDVAINSSATRIYFGTSNSSSEREFFILDISSKSGARPIISSYDTNGMSVNGIAIIEEHNRAILVGTGGEEYQVIDISNENSLSKCGGMEYNSGINDIDAVKDADNNSFSYIVTNNTTSDFQIIRGGPGLGGGESGYGYARDGYYTTQVFDSKSSNTSYFHISWDVYIPSNSTTTFQVRVGDTADLSSVPFIGPDGTSNTYFTNNEGSQIINLNNKRYFQARAYFTSDGTATPILRSVTLNYAK